MELSRLLPKPLMKIGSRYRGFREFLSDVLEGHRSLLGEVETTEPSIQFEVSNAFEHLGSLDISRRPMSEVFANLVPYFEAGACLVQKTDANGSHTHLTGLFLDGHAFQNETDMPIVELGLSKLGSGKIVKGNRQGVLRALGLESAKKLADADVFAFSPRKGFVVVLICNRPIFWQIEALESAYFFAADSQAIG